MTGLSELGNYAGTRINGRAASRARHVTGGRDGLAPARAQEPVSVLKRIREKDRAAVKECIDSHGDFVWTLARRFTNSAVEAEAVTEEIFKDIWNVSGSDCDGRLPDRQVIAKIALRRLIMRLWHGRQSRPVETAAAAA